MSLWDRFRRPAASAPDETIKYAIVDSSEYTMPGEIVLQLTHKDVVLSYFTSRKKAVLALKGGDRLDYADGYLYPHGIQKAVAKLSSKMLEHMTAWQSKGYMVHSASVRFIVAWKAKDAPREETETAVLLPELTLKKTQ